MRLVCSSLTLAAVATLGSAATAQAQGPFAVNVGSVTSTQSCTSYRNYEGSRLEYSESQYARWWGAAAARRYYAAHTTWRSYVVTDCQSNFQNLRNTLQAALAASGRLTTGRGGYTLNVTISAIGETPPAQGQPVQGENAYRTSWGTATVTASFTLVDARGANVDGGVLTKRIEMSRTLDTNNLRVQTAEPGASVYDLMQNEVALSIARDVAFAIDPLRVTAIDGDMIEVNYGRPLLELGDRLDVKQTGRLGALRYRVTSAGENDAVAEIDGDNDTFDVQLGNEVTFIEKDSDAANARRLPRRRLP